MPDRGIKERRKAKRKGLGESEEKIERAEDSRSESKVKSETKVERLAF
jgi:hypothetical protein